MKRPTYGLRYVLTERLPWQVLEEGVLLAGFPDKSSAEHLIASLKKTHERPITPGEVLYLSQSD